MANQPISDKDEEYLKFNEKLEESINVAGKNIDPQKKPMTIAPEYINENVDFIKEGRELLIQCRVEIIKYIIKANIDNQLKYIFGTIVYKHLSEIFFEEQSGSESLGIRDLSTELSMAFSEFRKDLIYKYESHRMTENENIVINDIINIMTIFGEEIDNLRIKKFKV